MTSPAPLYELEAELEGEYEGEFEGEWEGEEEGEEFLRRIVGLARKAARSPALRRVGLRAARAALGGLGDVGRAVAGPAGGRLGSAIGGVLSSQLPAREGEYEWEGEDEAEWEGEINPIRRVYADALMEHMGHAASQAETEAEAEAFLGALVPLAARLIPRVAPAIMRAAPGLVRGVARVGRTLLRSPATRPLVRAVPTIARRTAASLAQQVGQGRQITPRGAVRTLARQTARVLGSPQQVVRAVRRNRAADRRFHRVTGHPTRPRPAAGAARGRTASPYPCPR